MGSGMMGAKRRRLRRPRAIIGEGAAAGSRAVIGGGGVGEMSVNAPGACRDTR